MAKPDLRQALKPSQTPAPVSPPVRQEKGAGIATPADPKPGRVGKTNVTGYFDPAVKQQMRQLAAQISHKTTQQDLLAEAINLLFAKYGKPEIATSDNTR